MQYFNTKITEHIPNHNSWIWKKSLRWHTLNQNTLSVCIEKSYDYYYLTWKNAKKNTLTLNIFSGCKTLQKVPQRTYHLLFPLHIYGRFWSWKQQSYNTLDIVTETPVWRWKSTGEEEQVISTWHRERQLSETVRLSRGWYNEVCSEGNAPSVIRVQLTL